jgi:glycosyltransferase involved in cell wall biosynthesis
LISVIATVLNEGESLRRLLDSLVAQTQTADEVVIVDGGSRDNTVAILREYEARLPLRVIVRPLANISEGRNTAISAAQGDIIAVTDAGVKLAPDWLARLTTPLLADETLGVVSGFFLADAATLFEAAMGATVLPLAEELTPDRFLPSSRSIAFRKVAWERAGGYPEWLDYCEDLIFDLRLKDSETFALATDAVVYFRPRASLRSFYRQYYLYARGDGKADLWLKRHLIRYATYAVAGPLLVALALRVHKGFWLLLLAGLAGYLAQPYRRLPVVLQRTGYTQPEQVAQAALWVPVIRIVGDVAKMVGYPVGVWWRLTRKPPNWRR